MRKILIALLFFPVFSWSEVSRNNKVDWIVATSEISGGSNLIQWVNPLQNSGDCVFGTGTKPRTRLSANDKEIFSLLLAAKLADKNVGILYNTTASIPNVPGHGSGCEITSAWIESN